MRKTLTFLIAITSISVFGQLEWVRENDFRQECTQQVEALSSEGHAILHGFSSFDCSATKFTVLDGDGQEVFSFGTENDVGGFSVNRVNYLFTAPGNAITVAATVGGVDTLSGNGFTFEVILGFDSSGDIIQEVFPNNIFDIGMAAVLSDGSFVVLPQYQWAADLVRVSPDGSVSWELSMGGFDYTDMANGANDSTLVATTQGLLTVTPAGEVAALRPEHVFQGLETDGQVIVGATEDSLFLLAADYSLISKTSVGGEIESFDLSGGIVSVLTIADSVHLFNLDLSPLNSFGINDDMSCRTITLADTSLIIGGEETYGGPEEENTIMAAFLQEYSFGGESPELSNDIGVTLVEQGLETEVINNGQWGYQVVFKDVAVTVENFGEHPVESFTLWTNNAPRKKYENLSLQPGEAVELVWEEIRRTFSTDPAGINTELCIWTSHPDFVLDTDASNDTYCTGFFVKDNEVFRKEYLNIFPNPTSNYLNFQLWGADLTGFGNLSGLFRIIDAQGRTVKEFVAPKGVLWTGEKKETFTIPVMDLESGLYFLQYEVDGKVLLSEKFVVVN